MPARMSLVHTPSTPTPPRHRVVATAASLTLALCAGLVPWLASAAPAAAALSGACPSPGGVSIAEASAPDAEVVFSGHGYGHSLGMSQYGAQGAARLGCLYTDIVGTYFPGAALVSKPSPSQMLLWMLKGGTSVRLNAKTGPIAWTLAGCSEGSCPPVQPMGATWTARAAAAGSYQLLDAAGAQLWQGGSSTQAFGANLAGTVTALDSYQGSSLYLNRTVRWDTLQFSQGSDGLSAKLVLTSGFIPEWNATAIAMDKYLWGLAEVPISWTNASHEALKAQAVAGRTYALNKIYSGTTTLYATTSHQYYGGYAREVDDISYRSTAGLNLRWADAVRATSGQVLTNASTGAVLPTFFTSSHGGASEDERYVWGGTTDLPYISMLDDSRWDAASANSYRSWARGYTRAEVATKLGFDTITALTIAEPLTAARLAGLSVTGTISGVVTTKQLSGDTVRIKLGLPSPGFRVKLAAAPAPAPSPTPTATSTTPTATPTPSAGSTGSTTLILAPKSSTPTTSVPTTSVPTTSVPTTSVPTTSVPTTSVPTTSVPTTTLPLPPQARAPYAPRNIRAWSGRAGGTRTARLSWTAESFSGGVPMAGFYVRVIRTSTKGEQLSVTSSPLLPPTARSWEPILTPGTYRFQVRAANSVGRSALSVRSVTVIAR